MYHYRIAISIDFPSVPDPRCTDCGGSVAQDAACIVDLELVWSLYPPPREQRTYRHLACAIPLHCGTRTLAAVAVPLRHPSCRLLMRLTVRTCA